MVMISHNLNLILVIIIVIGGSVSSSAANFTEPCNGRCGGLTLPYPFGFSNGCLIRFDCSTVEKPMIGDFSVQNVTEDGIFVGLPHNCTRKIEDMRPLFSEHFAPTSENSFLMEDCVNTTDGCSIKQKFLENVLNLESCDSSGNISCFSLDSNSSLRNSAKFFSMKELRNSSCSLLFSSIAFESVGVNAGIALEFERVRLGWWLKGGCESGTCAANTNCTDVETPHGYAGHRCSCLDGYHGDGYINPCQRALPECRGSKLVWRHCRSNLVTIIGGTVGGAFLLAGLALLFYCKRRRSTPLRSHLSAKRLLSEAAGNSSVAFFPYKEIEKATDGFSEKQQLGVGAYGCIDEIIDPILDLDLDAWTLSSIHTVAELAFRCLAFHSDMRPTMTEVADELEQIRLSGWIPNMSLDSPAGSLRSSDRGSERSVKQSSTGSRRVIIPQKQLDNLASVEEISDSSPISVQDPWLSAQSSPSTNTLLGNIPR
ncbi:unnamed protein product [Arabidopsis arenosa]|uniref:EGF-like domain-containing protein n=1 Tax=Arabidopsis arenosa TaxID=38785 RepID=A0A8S2A3J6_ARAAE|nr:unnamed protein product [Arabidopsis arenosa]